MFDFLLADLIGYICRNNAALLNQQLFYKAFYYPCNNYDSNFNLLIQGKRSLAEWNKIWRDKLEKYLNSPFVYGEEKIYIFPEKFKDKAYMVKEIYTTFIKKPERTSKKYNDLAKLYQKTNKLSLNVEDFNKFIIGVFELATENTQRVYDRTAESTTLISSTDLSRHKNRNNKDNELNQEKKHYKNDIACQQDNLFQPIINNYGPTILDSTISGDFMSSHSIKNNINITTKEENRKLNSMVGIKMQTQKIFVIQGRNKKLNNAMFSFLTSLRLDPIEWEQARELTGKATPYIGEILEAAFNSAQAIIAMLTPDEEVQLLREHANTESELEKFYQPRPNVIFEAGSAFAINPHRTILVSFGNLRVWSDIEGRYLVDMNNTIDRRQVLANRLRTAGCDIDLGSSIQWHTQGDFTL